MSVLVTLEQAHAHLRLTWVLNASPVEEAQQADLELKLETAEAAILDACNTTEYWRAITPTWDVNTSPASVPPAVQAAVLLMLGHQYENRGDVDLALDDRLWIAIGRLLAKWRDPVVA